MYTVFAEHIFPFLRTGLVQLANGEESSYAQHMKDARFTIPNAGLLEKVVDIIDEIPMDERDTKGDLYEYMLGKIASAGTNGQFRTPRHIIDLMVKMTAPQPMEAICDPAAGTAGFLVQAGEYLRQQNPNLLTNPRAEPVLPPQPVPRLRLRQHHAAHRFHEHAPARGGKPGHHLPGFPGRPARYRGGKIRRHPRQPALRRQPGLRERRQGPAVPGQDQKDGAALPGPVPPAAQARRPGMQ
jgi:hypothetical protein